MANSVRELADKLHHVQSCEAKLQVRVAALEADRDVAMTACAAWKQAYQRQAARLQTLEQDQAQLIQLLRATRDRGVALAGALAVGDR